jgi:arsenate reductase-like glutaredoxin family protein/cytochrome c biogenesis protein CcdA
MRTFFIAVWLLVGVFSFGVLAASLTAPVSYAQAESVVADGTDPAGTVYLFGRDDCGFCKKQKEFMEGTGIPYTYLNITTDPVAKAQWEAVAAKHGLTKVTPITVVGETVLLGFNSPETTGEALKEAITRAETSAVRSVADHLALAPAQDPQFGGGCSEIGCTEAAASYTFDLPFLGIVDLKSFSLFALSLTLGTVDGFNPCAMWVLITFLMLLAQAGSRQKMLFLAGLFIVAEAIMYNLILNVWYKTWDFVALDAIVTPLVGILALGGGTFFLYRWHKSSQTALVCDITDLDTQAKTVGRLRAVINQPLTLTTIGAIVLIAFSVNVIEFACSIGIPQAYTKILDLNMLTFVERQWYILVYTFGYMIDDFIVFGLAIWGFTKLEAHGARYARYSLLIGGVLMLLLGTMLVFYPDLLVI